MLYTTELYGLPQCIRQCKPRNSPTPFSIGLLRCPDPCGRSVETEPPPDRGPNLRNASDSSREAPAPVPAVVPGVVDPLIAEVPGYHDRGTGLVIFGVLQIILGLLAALMVPFIALGAFMSRLAPGGALRSRPVHLRSRHLRIRCLRADWTRDRIGANEALGACPDAGHRLVLAYHGLADHSPADCDATPNDAKRVGAGPAECSRGPSPTISTGVLAVIITLIIIFAAVFLVLAPIAFVVFYSRKDVSETVRHRDPIERWTDQTPLPVLGASVVLAMGALYLLLVGVTTPVFPSSDNTSPEFQGAHALS